MSYAIELKIYSSTFKKILCGYKHNLLINNFRVLFNTFLNIHGILISIDIDKCSTKGI